MQRQHNDAQDYPIDDHDHPERGDDMPYFDYPIPPDVEPNLLDPIIPTVGNAPNEFEEIEDNLPAENEGNEDEEGVASEIQAIHIVQQFIESLKNATLDNSDMTADDIENRQIIPSISQQNLVFAFLLASSPRSQMPLKKHTTTFVQQFSKSTPMTTFTRMSAFDAKLKSSVASLQLSTTCVSIRALHIRGRSKIWIDVLSRLAMRVDTNRILELHVRRSAQSQLAPSSRRCTETHRQRLHYSIVSSGHKRLWIY